MTNIPRRSIRSYGLLCIENKMGVLYDHMDFYVLKTLWSNGKSDPNLLNKSGEAPPITAPFKYFIIFNIWKYGEVLTRIPSGMARFLDDIILYYITYFFFFFFEKILYNLLQVI